MPETDIGPMTMADVDAVHAIEADTFTLPWSRDAFIKEIEENQCARYLVLREDGVAVAFAGVWFVLDEGHITNIAVRRDRRSMGYGTRVTEALVRLAADSGMRFLTLECRRSNEIAQKMYHALGFKDVGYRKRFYEQPVEDALIMVLEDMPEGDPERDPHLIREGKDD